MKKIVWLVLVVFCLQMSIVFADRGSIPFNADVQIFEPNQRAIIGWNGQEEVLLLSTELQASKPTKILEVIPLPAEPVVTRGSIESFSTLTRIINKHIFREGLVYEGRSKGNEGSERPVAEVTFHEKIGAHDIAVIHVQNGEKFIEWVKDYLNKNGAGKAEISSGLQSVVAEYIKDGYSWFVFDVVELDTKVKTNDVIQYRFASKAIYYPLRITKNEVGNTKVDIIVVSQQLVSNFSGIAVRDVKLQHRPVSLIASQLEDVSAELYGLFQPQERIKVRMWRIEGDLADFSYDLIAN